MASAARTARLTFQAALADDLELVTATLMAEDQVGVVARGADGRVHVGVRQVIELADLST